MKHKKFKNPIVSVLIVALIGFFTSISYIPHAAALKLTAKRIFFEGRTRSENLLIINETNEEQTYRISWEERKMGPTGGLKPLSQNEIDAMGIKASDMVKYSPRRVTLAPQQSQHIRLALRRPGDLPDGEYRSHLRISTEPKPRKNKGTPTGRLGATIDVDPAITIPVYVRKGNLEGSLNISDLNASMISADTLNIKFRMNREGNKSIYARTDMICNMLSPNAYILRSLKWIPIYTDTAYRQRAFNVKIPEGQPLCRSVSIRMHDADSERTILLAEGTTDVYTQ